jgi:hypothetical protein
MIAFQLYVTPKKAVMRCVAMLLVVLDENPLEKVHHGTG